MGDIRSLKRDMYLPSDGNQARDRVKRRRLSGSVGTDQRDDFALVLPRRKFP